VKIKSGNIFTTQCKTIVNTVNCFGVMGAGIAYEFKIRYPKMFETYKSQCEQKIIKTGKLYYYELSNDKSVINFPTKDHWRRESKIEYLTTGLDFFVANYKAMKIESIAFPLLGAANGGIDPDVSLNIMRDYLSHCNDIDIEIWTFNQTSKDDLYDGILTLFAKDEKYILENTKVKSKQIHLIKMVISNGGFYGLNSLFKITGITDIGLSSIVEFLNLQEKRDLEDAQLSLFG
jgi:O-acetyl-ADP-ribose deacetylase (regulator of RNase III)